MTSEKSVVLITGASRGIGRTMVEVLTANGHSVVAAARPSTGLDDLCRATGAIPVALDVSDLAAVSDAVANVEATFGPVSLLVNNAGIAGQSEPTWLHDADAWWHVFEVNVKGVFACSRAVLPLMLARHEGRIINVSSGAALRLFGKQGRRQSLFGGIGRRSAANGSEGIRHFPRQRQDRNDREHFCIPVG
jgi:NADP-dependent 3-hydroxy acid dehydrogenase YdfG